jgi:hypothetical protein
LLPLRQDDAVKLRTPASLAVAAVLALGASVAGCGNTNTASDSFATYCATVHKYQAIFSDDGTGLALVTNVAKLRAMAAVAPDDLKDEWQTFLDAISGLDTAIKSVGLKPSLASRLLGPWRRPRKL